MEAEIISAFEEFPGGGDEAQAVAARSIFTQAETTELEATLKNAVAFHFAQRKALPTFRPVKVLPHAFRFAVRKANSQFQTTSTIPIPRTKTCSTTDLFF